jgi:hypothetical protein
MSLEYCSLCTIASATTCCAGISASLAWVEVVFVFKQRSVCPGEEVFEDCTQIIEVLSPAAPSADVAKWPAEHHGQILATSAVKQVRSIGAGVNANVT